MTNIGHQQMDEENFEPLQSSDCICLEEHAGTHPNCPVCFVQDEVGPEPIGPHTGEKGFY